METITPNINLVSITCHNAFSTNINSVYNSMCPIFDIKYIFIFDIKIFY